MAKRGHRYPQGEARAADVMDPRVANVAASASENGPLGAMVKVGEATVSPLLVRGRCHPRSGV